MSYDMVSLPPQQLPMSKKNKKWRRAHLDWATGKTFFNYSPVRNSTIHKKINYDLLVGQIHMQDIEHILNPEQVKEKVTPAKIQHYPIMNTKLDVLKGEEISRAFDYRVAITNPLALSEKEESKKNEVYQRLQALVQNQSQSQEEYEEKINQMGDFFTYEWQDMREVKANALLNHYSKEYNMPLLFSEGFMNALAVGEEIYQCDIRGGEPIIEKVNPLNIRIFKSGYSNRVEDADVIIIEDYWSPGKIIDTFYDVLTKKDLEYIENAPNQPGTEAINEMGEQDERIGFINKHMTDETFDNEDFYFDPFGVLGSSSDNSLLPFDTAGNIRVVRMYWKSRRRIKKVKSYDPETGEEVFNFYPETYVIDEARGEEEQIYYINEAWEGTKIGEEVYVNIRPRIVQYNRLSNPSRCHFGIVGSIYNLNDNKPFSLVDRMKPYNYLYDVIHDRLTKMIAKNWGKIVKVDLALIPKGWDFDKWMYFARHNSVAIIDSFKAGLEGPATGKLAGSLNNASSGYIDAELGNSIQQYVQLLEFIKMEMAELAGVNRQREGQVTNRETVGGVERAVLQSSHITEWLFATHEDVKKRTLECFLETAKIALKGRSTKFQYILSDGSMQITEIDGDQFAEADYGLIVDNTNGTQELQQKLDSLAQAALQNQALSFSTIMKLYTSVSSIEKQRLVQKDEQEMLARQQQMQQQQIQAQQEQAQMAAQQKEAEMQLQDQMNQRDNETKLIIAQLQAQAKFDGDGIQENEFTPEKQAQLLQQMQEFDAQMRLDEKKLSLEERKQKEVERSNRANEKLKEKQINKTKKQTNT